MMILYIIQLDNSSEILILSDINIHIPQATVYPCNRGLIKHKSFKATNFIVMMVIARPPSITAYDMYLMDNDTDF